MEGIKYFVSTIHRENGAYTKNVTIHDTLDAAKQAFFNEFTAWAFGKKENCDYVCAYIHESTGVCIRQPEVWQKATEPEA